VAFVAAKTCRDRSHLLNVRDVLLDRRGRDQIFLNERGFDAATLQMTFGAIALNAARRAGKASAGAALDSLLDGESEIAVGACRDRSRHVVGHCIDDTAGRPTARRLVDAIRNDQYRFKESEARMKYLAERAENLKCAEAQIRSAESVRRATEQELEKANARLEETEKELMRALSRITDAETQLTRAEERGRAMEARALHAEGAFNQLEGLIRTQLVELSKDVNKRSDLNRRSARAA